MSIAYLTYGSYSSDSGYATRTISELDLIAQELNPILVNFGNNLTLFISSNTDIKKQVKSYSFKCYRFRPFFILDLIKIFVRGRKIFSQNAVKIIHAQGLYAAFLAISYKILVARRIKVVFDIHGLVPHEYIWLKKGKKWGLTYFLLRFIERLCVEKSDHLVCASKTLKKFFENQYRRINTKITVITNITPFPLRELETLHRIKSDLKKQFGLEKSLVLLHVGSLLQWTEVEETIKIFKKFSGFFSNAFFLIITSEEKKSVCSYLVKHRIPESQFLVTHIPHENIHQVIPIGDLGLVIRDNSLINQVAFPTKFSEYLACGVPVLCSSSIKDIAQDVKMHELGYILKNNELGSDILTHIADEKNLGRKRYNCISYFAKELERIKEKFRTLYKELTKI